LILSGDQLYQIDFGEVLAHHIEKNAQITVATIPVTEREATSFGILRKGPDGFIQSFIEKPDESVVKDWQSDVHEKMQAEGKVYLASMGIYIFNRDVLFEVLNEHSVATDFGKEIIPQGIEQYRVLSYEFDGYWTDIGSIPSFFEANMDLTEDMPRFNLFDNGRYIYTRARMLPPTKMSGTRVNKSLIAEGCIIQAKEVDHALLGIRTRIGHGSTISHSYIMGHDYFQTIEDMQDDARQGLPFVGVGENSHLKNCIVDKGARIGNNVYINGGLHLPDAETEHYTIREGIVVIKKNAVIPNGFTIG
jgi:glucose-1-phosphate adenylyltransferase